MATLVRVLMTLAAIITSVIINSAQLASSMPTGDPILIGKRELIINHYGAAW